MRKAVLPLLLLVSCVCYASFKHSSYTFQFSNPKSLLPSVVFTDDDTNIAVTDYVFQSSDGAVNLSFTESNLGGGLGAYIDTRVVDNTIVYHLDVASGVQMFVRGIDGVQLDSLVFSSDSYTGGLFLNSPIGVGEVTPFRDWYGQGAKNVHELHYVQNGHNPRIYGMTVYYSAPQNIFKPISPVESATIKKTSFRSLALSFGQKVKLSSYPKFTLTSNQSGFISPSLKAEVNKSNPNEIIISLSDGSSITDLGDYTLTIGENSIVSDDDESYNPELVYSIKVVASYAYSSVSPAAGNVAKIPNGIIINFPSAISLEESALNQNILLVDHDGTTVRRMKMEYADSHYKSVKLVFQDGKTADVTESGVYTFTVPEGLIWNGNHTLYNADITIEYNIGNQQYASEEKLAEAREWLSYEGVGYPSAESDGRTVLEEKVREEKGTDAIFDNYIAAYIAENDVTLPTNGKWYRISAQALDGSKVYIARGEGRFVLSKKESDAVRLQATKHGNTFSFATIDGLYLRQLQPNSTNASATYSASDCNLTLAHIDLPDVDAEKEFGLMTIWGKSGINLNGQAEQTYAVVDVTTPSIEAGDKQPTQFTNTLTSAFRLEETEKPAPTIDYSIAPSPGLPVDTLQFITVKFNTDSPVSVANDAYAELTRSNGLYIKSTSITSVQGESNTFKICFEDVPAGTCNIKISEGTFTFVDEGRTLSVPEISLSYTIYYSMSFQADLNDRMSFYVYGLNYSQRYSRDTDLNNFVYYTDHPYTFGISDKKANIVRLTTGKEEIVNTGHFEQVDSFDLPGYEGCGAIHLVLDNPIKEGDIESGEYLIDIFEGTFGDANFAKYLKDPTSIAKNQCHVNKNDFYVLLIDNEKAAQQEIVYPSDKVLAKAENLLELKGLGYPKSNSKARQDLQALAETKQGADSLYLAKIDAYLKDADVQMPDTGKWYRIAKVTSEGQGYVRFTDNEIQMTTEAVDATAFKADYNANDSLTLCSAEGLFLHSIADNGLSAVSTGIALEHLVGTNDDAETVFGLFSINKVGYYRLYEVPESEIILPDVAYMVDPANGAEVETLETIVVTFNTSGEILQGDLKLITFSGTQTSDAVSAPKTVRLENNSLKLSFINLPADTYTLTIAEGALSVKFSNSTQVIPLITSSVTVTKGIDFNVDDYMAQGILTWKEDPKDAFVKDSYMNDITLVSNTQLAFDEYQNVEILCDDEKVATGRFVALEQNEEGKYQYKLILFFDIVEGSHPKGFYQVVIPEATFGDENFGQYLASPRDVLKSDCHVNASIILTANVDNEEVEKQQIVYPSDEVLAKAEHLLSLKGLGYPREAKPGQQGSKSREELQALVSTPQGANSQESADSLYLAKIDAYLKDTDVELPEMDKWYLIGAVSATDTTYVQFDDNKLFQGNADFATGFTVGYDQFGNMTLNTIDGLYLKSIADDGLVDEPSSISIGHQVGEGVDAESVFGLFSINNIGYYHIVEIPVEEVNLPKVSIAFTPENNSEVEALDVVTVTFETRGTVVWAKKDKIKLIGEKTAAFVTKPVDSSFENNVLKLTFINLPADTYTLVADSGAFTVTYGERIVDVPGISCSIKVTEGAQFVAKDYGMEWLEDPKDEYVIDTYLNKFTLVSSSLLSVDGFKETTILCGSDTVATGTFADPNPNSDGSFSYRLRFKKPIEEGKYPQGTFKVVIPEGTFGDENFGKYLEDSRSVKKSDCLVNNEMVFTANVDNVKAYVMAVAFTATPAAGDVENLDEVTLTFGQEVTLANPSLLTFTTSDGVVVEPMDIKQIGDNIIRLKFVNLEKGGYVLTADTGAFTTYNFLGKECLVEKFSVSYNLTKSVDFIVGYEKDIQLSWLEDPKGLYVKDSDLNSFTLVSSVPLVFNPEKAVIIKDVDGEVARGHMEMVPVDNARSNAESIADYVYSLVLDKPIAEGSLAASTYVYVLDKETFGDYNYGAYLEDPKNVSKASCHVNSEMKFTVKVDNKIAVGIREVGVDADDAPIYDVYGRKVSGQLKKGQVYIKNGKKFIKK